MYVHNKTNIHTHIHCNTPVLQLSLPELLEISGALALGQTQGVEETFVERKEGSIRGLVM